MAGQAARRVVRRAGTGSGDESARRGIGRIGARGRGTVRLRRGCQPLDRVEGGAGTACDAGDRGVQPRFQGEGAPDALLMNVKTQVRSRPQDAPIGSLISLSIRISEPGYAKELLADLDTVFQELNTIGGLLGYSFGTRVGMAEEVLGMGIWAKFSDFETSLPMAPKNSELRVYRRVA